MNTFMLDTTEFNHLLDDGEIRSASFVGRRLLVTGVQEAELRATTNHKRRADLLAVLEQVNPTVEAASSLAWNIEGAGWGQARWNDGSGKFEKMLNRLRELDRKKHKKPYNQTRDILIAETAIKNGATLVSSDCNLRQVVSEFRGHAIDHLPA
jgi:predicted nucleic acid-binding protein